MSDTPDNNAAFDPQLVAAANAVYELIDEHFPGARMLTDLEQLGKTCALLGAMLGQIYAVSRIAGTDVELTLRNVTNESTRSGYTGARKVVEAVFGASGEEGGHA